MTRRGATLFRLAVLVPDAVLGLVAARCLGWAAAQPDPPVTASALPPLGPGHRADALLTLLVLGSLAGTWCAVFRRGNHPSTVNAGVAVAVLRLVLLGTFTALWFWR
jgi:hypothetical protein